MKKEECVNQKVFTNISIDDAVKEIIEYIEEDGDIGAYEEDELIDYIDNYLYDYEITDEERSVLYDKLLPALKILRNKVIEEESKEEAEQLSNRDDILYLIEGTICYNAICMGEVGFRLTSEEILDLILKNGNKNRS